MLYSDGASSYIIHRFMTYNLGLRGAELNVYALIYSFCQGKEKKYVGSREYIAESVGVTVKTVERALKSLTERELLKRHARRGYSSAYYYEVNYTIIDEIMESMVAAGRKIRRKMAEEKGA